MDSTNPEPTASSAIARDTLRGETLKLCAVLLCLCSLPEQSRKFATEFPTLSLTPTMAKLTHNRHGNLESVLAKPSRGTAARSDDDAHGLKTGSPKGFGSQKSRGDKVAKELVANAGKSSTVSTPLAMADRATNLQGNQESVLAVGTGTIKARRTDISREASNGKNQGPASPNPGRNKFAKKVTTTKTTDDRVKNGKQLHNEGRGAVLARLEQKRARGKPQPKRGDVKKAIVEAGVKKLIDTGKTYCCAPGLFDVDAFVQDLPSPTRSEPTATFWAKVEI